MGRWDWAEAQYPGKSELGSLRGAGIAGPGIITDRFVEIADDRLVVGSVPTEGGGIVSDTLGEGEDDVVVEETERSGVSDTVVRVERDGC